MSNEVVGRLRARTAAWRHGNPGRGLKIIGVSGASGKTTTVMLLGELLQETNKSVITLTNQGSFYNGEPFTGGYDHSAEAVQRALSVARKKNVGYVIMEVSDALVATQVLPTLVLEMSVVVNDCAAAQALLMQPVDYTVVPAGFDVAGLSVAPHQAISFGEDSVAEAHLTSVKELRRGTELELVIDHQTKLPLATYLVGKMNALNVSAAVSAAYVLAADTSSFEEGVARLERVAGNFDYIARTNTPFDTVVDAAHSAASVSMLLATARALKKRRLLVAVDRSVPEGSYDELKRLSDRAVIVGEAPDVPGVEKAETIQAAYDLLKRSAKKDDTVLLVGQEFASLESEDRTIAHHMVEAAAGE